MHNNDDTKLGLLRAGWPRSPLGRKAWPSAPALRRTVTVTLVLLAGALALRSGTAPHLPPTTGAMVGLTTGQSGMEAVAVRPSNPGVVNLLHPGTRVDVIVASPDGQRQAVGPHDGTVLAMPAEDPTQPQGGRLIVIELPRPEAVEVAEVSLRQAVTVTLR